MTGAGTRTALRGTVLVVDDEEGVRASVRAILEETCDVLEAPNGAHFTSCVPDYGRDEAFQKRYAAAAADPGAWRRFTEQYLQGDEAAYQKAVQQ